MPSTVIKRFTYDSKKARLYVTFLSGKVYAYLNVPESVYEEMKAALSKGKYLNEYVKGKYEFKAV
ncbi:KTSC domain-containing protein [Chitinophaga niabensis]|uniref:KTSC domain-containing protein n=1 Tax=Chitinophaga niabensis TaxID=536979 RepID=A0A1N6JZZ3_9BACT|nr:KTSC domain-containing protein [Chitinophaga niabensis]SIO49821.1 KTSC domain-containing protein [Chitinophaga niabensis]